VLLEHLSWPQLAGWIAWLKAEPRGYRRDDMRAGLQAFQLARQWGHTGTDPEEFILRFTPLESQISDPETAALVADYFSM